MVSVKSYAKLNISLKITGVSNGYHDLDSVVCSVDKYDLITAKKRKDDKILVSFKGKYGFIPKLQEETIAYKTAKAFMDGAGVKGVELTVYRNIPDGSGMGGSSADIAGVLTALKKLYKLNVNVEDLADLLGSDSKFMLNGGFARLQGRGNIIKPLNVNQNYYFIVIYSNIPVTAKESFSLYDELGAYSSSVDIDMVERGVLSGDLEVISKYGGNDLTESSIKLNGEIKRNLSALKDLSPAVCFMTGSGSTCFSMYKEYEMASWAYNKLKRTFGESVELLYSIEPNKPSFFDTLFKK